MSIIASTLKFHEMWVLLRDKKKFKFNFLNDCVLFAGPGRRRNISNIAMDIFDNHQGTHILQVHYSNDDTI